MAARDRVSLTSGALLKAIYDPDENAYTLVVEPQGNVASGATDSGNPVKIGLKYNATPPTLTDGQRGDVQGDFNANLKTTLATGLAGEDLTNYVLGTLPKPVASATYAPTVYTYWAGSVTKANIKASAGSVFSLIFTNTNASVRYVQLHNKATAPAAAETPIQSFVVPAGTTTQPGILILDSSYFAPSHYFSTGIGWAVSTTIATFTDSATAGEHTITVRYI